MLHSFQNSKKNERTNWHFKYHPGLTAFGFLYFEFNLVLVYNSTILQCINMCCTRFHQKTQMPTKKSFKSVVLKINMTNNSSIRGVMINSIPGWVLEYHIR